MNEILRRRRALMGYSWEKVSFDKTSFVYSPNFGTVTYDAQTDTIHCAASKTGTYKGADAPFTTEQGYQYRIECDYQATAGVARMGPRSSTQSFLYFTSQNQAPASGHYTLEFQHDSRIAMLTLMTSMATSVKGNVSYVNLKIYRRPL